MPRERFTIQPIGVYGVWTTNFHRYYANAHRLLLELVLVCNKVVTLWPADKGSSLKIDDPLVTQELKDLTEKRDLLSDSVQIYSAMAVEGFLNWYGVMRLGERVFNEQFERLGLVPKLRSLLIFCDGHSIPKDDPIVTALIGVAEARNKLLHPKANALTEEQIGKPLDGDRTPEFAQYSVRNMKLFFKEFNSIVPELKVFTPELRTMG